MVMSQNPRLGTLFYNFFFQNDYFRAVQKLTWYNEFILEKGF